jgi:hypothetical protein
MTDRLKPKEIKRLKSRFREAGVTVRDLDDSTFEVVDDDFPVRTHVSANPFYLQLGTYILAKPRRPVKKPKVQELLCDINLRAKLVKFTMDVESPEKETAAWPLFASVKLITGVAGGNYQPAAIKNMFLLWLQDIAELMANAPESFEIHPMMDMEKLKDD